MPNGWNNHIDKNRINEWIKLHREVVIGNK